MTGSNENHLMNEMNAVRVCSLTDYKGAYYNTWDVSSAHPVPQDPSETDTYWPYASIGSATSDTSSTASGKLWV